MKKIFTLLIAVVLFLFAGLPAANAQTYYYGSSIASTVGATGTDDDQFIGNGSWKNNQTAPYFEMYLNLSVFGSFTIDEIDYIKFETKKATLESAPDFFAKIYTVGTLKGWYNYRLNAEPYFSNSLNAPANQWNEWNTNEGANQLTFFDQNVPGVGFGFYGQPDLQDLKAGTINWNTYSGSAGATSIDYGAEEVKFIVLGTGSGWNSTFDGLLDKIIVSVNGTEVIWDLEGSLSEVWVDDDWAGKSPGDVVGTHIFGNDAFATIANGISAVIEGGTVNVAAGTYHEQVKINKSLKLYGAQANVTPIAGGRPGGESIILGGINNATGVGYQYNQIDINADNVEVNGFECSSSKNFGITTKKGAPGTTNSNVKIKYNWVHSVEPAYVGIVTGLNVTGYPSSEIIFNNYEISYNLVSAGGAKAIAPSGGVTYNNLNISYNDISCSGAGGRGIFAGGGPGFVQFNNAVITYNNLHNITETGINLINLVNADISHNTFTNILAGAYLVMSGGAITDNTLSGLTGSYYGLKITSDPTWKIPVSMNVEIANNSITYNDNALVPNTVGLLIDGPNGATQVVNAASLNVHDNSFINANAGSSTGSYAIKNLASTNLPATCNWFGTTNATDVTAAISGDVTYAPYNVSAGGPCAGVLPIITTIETPIPTSCGTLDVPVTVQDFNNVANVSLVLNYDAAVLDYQSVDINSALTGAYSNGAAGTFILGRNSSTNEITLPDNTVLFTLHFNILSSAVGGSTTDLTWDESATENNEYSSAGTYPYVYPSTFTDLTGIVIPEWLVRNITQSTNFCTIQDAIDDAATVNGDVIVAAAGTYVENLNVYKTVNLRGANYGISAGYSPGSRGPESVIVGQASVSAANVSFDGLEFYSPLTAGTKLVQPTVAGLTITFQNNVFDMKDQKSAAIYNDGKASTIFNILNNEFKNQYYDGSYSSRVIYAKNTFCTITGNDFSEVELGLYLIGNSTDATTVSGNRFSARSASVLVGGRQNIQIINNDFVSGGAIYCDATSNLTIENNSFGIGVSYALQCLNTIGSGIVMKNNSILSAYTSGTITGKTLFNSSTTQTVVATCNWWGTVDASLIATKISGTATYTPWLVDGTDLEPLTPGFQPVVGCDEIPPVVTGPMDELVVSGCDVTSAPAAVTTVAALEAMGAVIEDNPTADDYLVVTSSDVSAGTCPIVITRTYTITDQSGNSSTINQTITITHLTPPAEVGGPVQSASTVECVSALIAPATLPAVQDMCGTVLTPGAPVMKSVYVNKFDEAVVTGPSAAPGVWYADRYAPAGFATASFNGGNRLKHSILATDGASSRPGAYSGAFYNTQGRKYDLGAATDAIEVKLYIPADWATSNKRMAGLWSTAVDVSNTVSAYPVVEFTSDGENARFSVWEADGTWVNIGLPVEFAYNSWVTLKIKLLANGQFLVSAGSLNYVTTKFSATSVKLANVILQGHNYDPVTPTNGVTYDIYWDDFTWNDTYAAIACEGAVSYTYNYADCAGSAFAWTYTYTIERTTVPAEVGTPVANSSTVYSIAAATAPAVLPVVEDVCGTVLNPTEANPVPVDVITDCAGTRTYTYTYVDCADLQYVWTYTYTLETSTVSGTLKYNNSVKTPMNLVKLVIKDNLGTQVGPVVTTDGNGAFEFTDLCAGIYTIHVTYNIKDLGGINSTDAGAVNAWGATNGSNPIEHVKFLAGDVTNALSGVNEKPDKFISADDALKIQRKFVFHEDFADATPDWVYWKAGEIINHNESPYATEAAWPTEITIVVNGNIPDLKLYGMATGDFNGSLVPTTLKSASASLALTENNNLQIGANQAFELPLRAASAMQVGAVSMVLDIPSDLVTVQNVKIKGSNEPVMWTINGNELRIGWYSLKPVNVAENGALVTLELMTTNAFAKGQTMDIELPFNQLNELADGNFEAIESAELMVAIVGNQTVGTIGIDKNGGLLFSNYPNPFSKVTTLEYSLPVDGKVNLSLYNNLGQLVTVLVDAEQSAGQHMFRYESNTLQPGIYVAKLRLVNSETEMVGTIKLSVQK